MSIATQPELPSSADRTARVHAERVRINVFWLIKLRWAAAAGQFATVLFVTLVLGIDLLLTPLLSIIALEVLTNGAMSWWFRRQLSAGVWQSRTADAERMIGGIMLLDVLLLSGLLYFSGGSFNPFSVFYLVNLSLAAVLLPARWTAGLVFLAFACYVSLFFIHQPLPALAHVVDQTGEDVRIGGRVSLYFKGLLAAFGGAATFIAYFITHLNNELSRLESQLGEAERRKAEAEKLEALATLAAGAAHELATPLSTIAVVARELELELERAKPNEAVVEDMRLIQDELTRCRAILDRMGAQSGEDAGEEHVRLTLSDLTEESLVGLRERSRVQVDCPSALGDEEVVVPKYALTQSLRSIVQNALDASSNERPVWVSLRRRNGAIEFSVRDRGHGMAEKVLSRAGDPFFTTKDPDQGMGLGLFLARRVIERLGGTLRLESQPGEGTTAKITLPEKNREFEP